MREDKGEMRKKNVKREEKGRNSKDGVRDERSTWVEEI